MFQRKIGEIFKELPNIFGIADYILVEGYNDKGTYHGRSLCRVVQICRKENLRFNKDKYHLRCTSVPIFGKIISGNRVRPDAFKLFVLTEKPASKTKEEQQSFLGIIHYLNQFSPVIAMICEPLSKVTSVNNECTLNQTYP